MAKTGYTFRDGSWMEFEGLEETIVAFEKIEGEEANNMMVASAKEGAEVILAKAKQLCPVGDTGNLRDSLEVKQVRVRAKKYSRHLSQPLFTVGPKYVRYNRKGGVNYGHLVELGHGIKLPGSKRYVGEAKPKPYLRPAADENKENVTKIIIDALNRTIELFGEDAATRRGWTKL